MQPMQPATHDDPTQPFSLPADNPGMTETPGTSPTPPFDPREFYAALWFAALSLPPGTTFYLSAELDEFATQVLVLYRPYATA